MCLLCEKCPYSEFFWSVFSRIRTEYGEIQSIFPYSVRMRKNSDQKNSECGHFSRSVCCVLNLFLFTISFCYVHSSYTTKVYLFTLFFYFKVGACFRYRRDTDLLNSARAKLCASEGDLTKIYQASDYHDVMDVFKDWRSPKSAVPESFHSLPSTFPPSFLNKYQENAIQNPIIAGIFPDEKMNRIKCSASFHDFTKTTQSQTVKRIVDKKPVKDNKNGTLKQKFKRFTNLSNLKTLLHH